VFFEFELLPKTNCEIETWNSPTYFLPSFQVKVPFPAVNFINVLHACFLYESLFGSFFLVTFEQKKHFHMKNARIKRWWNWHLISYLEQIGLRTHFQWQKCFFQIHFSIPPQLRLHNGIQISKRMSQTPIAYLLSNHLRANFTNVLHTVFTRAYPKSGKIMSSCQYVNFTNMFKSSFYVCRSQKSKKILKTWLDFYTFGICKRKSCAWNVDEIDPWR